MMRLTYFDGTTECFPSTDLALVPRYSEVRKIEFPITTHRFQMVVNFNGGYEEIVDSPHMGSDGSLLLEPHTVGDKDIIEAVYRGPNSLGRTMGLAIDRALQVSTGIQYITKISTTKGYE